jgi:hypothetical protein
VEDILEMEKLMYGSDTDDTDDTDMSDTAQSEFRQDFSQTQKLEGGTCVCDECIEMRNAVATWDDWAPEDEAEMYLKQRVTSAVSILPVEEGG